MEELKKEIENQIEILKEMIHQNKEKSEIEKQRKILDKLLIDYTKDLDWKTKKHNIEIKYNNKRNKIIYSENKIW